MVFGETLTARKPPRHRADFIERDVELCQSRLADVAVGCRELKPRTDLFRRPARRGEPGSSGPWVIPIGLGQIEDHTIHGPPHLVEEVPVGLSDDGKERLKPRRCLKCLLLNDESHE